MLLAFELPSLTNDPVWPVPLILLVVATLVGLTLWTYLGSRGTTRPKRLLLVGLRLLALFLLLLALLQQAIALPEGQDDATLLILVDSSRSMSIADMAGRSRWDYLRQTLDDCEPILRQLEKKKVRVVRHRFAHDFGDYDPAGQAEGLSTDFGQGLSALHAAYGRQKRLRGVIILSDGARNGPGDDARALATPWRRLPCPITTVAFGDPTTSRQQNDIALVKIEPNPSPVPVKGKLTVKGLIRSFGYRNQRVAVRLLLEDKEVGRKEVILQGERNDALRGERKVDEAETFDEVVLTCDAPATVPALGELKVTLQVEPVEGEVNRDNNELSTFVRVTKEGVKVLYVEGKYRAWEPKFLRQALTQGERISLDEAVWLEVERPPARQAEWVQKLDKELYDVIILGDISPNRLSGGDPAVLERIKQLVLEKGTGLMMMGGYESFTSQPKRDAGPGDERVWKGTPIADLLPVELDDGQVEKDVKMVPTEEGLAHFVLRLADGPERNRKLWGSLRPLRGMNKLGAPRPGATVMARANDGQNGPPVLVGWRQGKAGGRILAFAGDTTWRWRRNPEGMEAHARFWKQVVLWLARQEDVEGTIWVKPDPFPQPSGAPHEFTDPRRVRAGGKFRFQVGVRGKSGVDLPGGLFQAVVKGPNGATVHVDLGREGNITRGVWGQNRDETRQPGEYLVEVSGHARDLDGQEVKGETKLRFLVYQDDLEMKGKTADPDFLHDLAGEGGGEFLDQPEKLAGFLRKLADQPRPVGLAATRTWPTWRGNTLSPFLVVFFLAFVGLLCVEWGLRRLWGMV
jgi:uncharacterized membrane protein